MRISAIDDSRTPLDEIYGLLDLTEPYQGESSYLFERRGAILPLLFGTKKNGLRPSLGRLTLNISNACNLVCHYCYADHGLYHAQKSLMGADRARQLVDRVVELYRAVETVQFFGGEPLMNVAAIDAIGEAFEQAVAERRLSKMPTFVATTNGTLSTSRVLASLRRWKVSLTISWDGPDAIHDLARPTATGKSSARLLRQSLERFDKNGTPYEIECTYSRAHLEAECSVVDLMEFFMEETGQRVTHIAPAFLPDASDRAGDLGSAIFDDHGGWRSWQAPLAHLIPAYREAAAVSVRNILAARGPILEFAKRIVEQLVEKSPSATYCPAFFSQMSIATDGSVFPCFMFIGDQNFRLGNLFSDSFPTDESRRVFSRYFTEFGEGATGSSAWYAPLSSGCIAGDAIATGSFGRRAMAPLFEAMAEECILGLAADADINMGASSTKESENV